MYTTVDPGTQALTSIALILLLGLIFSIVSKKLQVSNILVLMLVGIVLGLFDFSADIFSSVFLVAIAVLTLVMVVFDGSSRFDLKMVSMHSLPALRVTSLFMLGNMVFLTLFTVFLFFSEFTLETVLFSMLYAILMSGTDPGSVFIMLKSKTNRVIEFLEVEAIVNTPVMVILPFIILEIINNAETSNVASIIFGQAIPFLKQVVVGVGSGVFVGLIVLKSMKKYYWKRFSHVGLITAALISYILAENLEGNGVLGVATLGLFFGNIYVKHKESLQEFNAVLSNSLVIIVFILIGLIVDIEFSWLFLFKAFLLYIVLTLTRLIAISFGLRTSSFSLKDKVFMAISMPKGIAAAVVAFSLSVFPIATTLFGARDIILQLIIVTMVYSLMFSSVIDRFSEKLIHVKLTEK